jgi:hypothetical protein
MTITPVILDEDDCGWAAVLTALDTRHNDMNTVATRRFVAYIQRKAAPVGDVLICERTSTGLGPSLGTLPGPKEGTVALESGIDEIIVTYTGRVVGTALDAPFKLQEARIPVPGIYPIDLAAALRARYIARIVSKYVPAASGDLLPYTK